MIEYTIDEAQHLIRVQMSGSNTFADLEQHYVDVYNDPKYNVTFNALFKVDPDAGGPLLEEMPKTRVLLELVAESQKARKKWAVVISSTFKRSVVEFLLKDVHLKPVELRFFGNEKDALAWLGCPLLQHA